MPLPPPPPPPSVHVKAVGSPVWGAVAVLMLVGTVVLVLWGVC